jgi:tetratricopeptide (TPR) repeat protein
MKLFVCFGLLLSLGLGVCSGPALAQPTSPYDTLIQQGKAQLQAGGNDEALATAELAIKMDANRWEGYALAGGALMNLKRFEEAADRFSKAIELAPQNKQDGLRELRRQCFAAESGVAPSPSAPARTSPTGPEATTTQAEIVVWKSIENSTKPVDFQLYLSQYPNGAFAAMAHDRLDKLAKADSDAQAALNVIRTKLKPVTIGSKAPVTITPTGLELKACQLTVTKHKVDPTTSSSGSDAIYISTWNLNGPALYSEVQDQILYDQKYRASHPIHFWSVLLGSRNETVVSSSCSGWQRGLAADHFLGLGETYQKIPCTGTATMSNSGEVYAFIQSDQSDAQELAETLKTLIAICSK